MRRPGRLFSVACLFVLAGSCLLGGRILFASYHDLTQRQASLRQIGRLDALLTATNRISAERGPTNSLLGMAPGEQVAARARLAGFRALSDASLAVVLALDRIDRAGAEDVAARLAQARSRADALAARPLEERGMQPLSGLVAELFGLTTDLQSVTDRQIAPLLQQDSSTAAMAILAVTLSDLRELAGRLGSLLMPFLVTHHAPSPALLAEAERMTGRLLQLREVVATQLGGVRGDPGLLDALAEIDRVFFGRGQPLIAGVLAGHGREDGYGLTMAELTDRYVPTMRPLEVLRDLVLRRMVEDSRARRDAAWRWVLVASGVTAMVLVVQGAILAWALTRVFRPLLRAHDEILAMAAGGPTQGRGLGARPAGLAPLFGALDVLAARQRELRRIEIEREALERQLRREADTDALTGLPNRRAMERIAAGHGPIAPGDPMGVILIDIDRFKRINDGHGHAAGDRVLCHVAAVLRAHLPEDCIVGRFGGEEFLVLLPEDDAERVWAVAERCRAALAAQAAPLPDGAGLTVTASFGTAAGRCDPRQWPALAQRADVALYQAKRDGRNRVGPVRPAPPEPEGADADRPDQRPVDQSTGA